MEKFNEYTEVLKKSADQYTAFTKKMQETAASALQFQLQATKDCLDWTMKTNSKLMEDYIAFSTTARETLTENMEVAKKTFEESVNAARKSA